MTKQRLKIVDIVNYLKMQGVLVGKRATRGDVLSAQFELAYREWFASPLDIRLQDNLVAIAEDYVRRELFEASRAELIRRELKNE